MSRNLNADKTLSYYLKELRKYPLLTSKQEKKLAKDYWETKNEASRQKLIKHNLRLVLKSTLGLKGWANKASDLIQEGNLGLMKAVDKFEYWRGVSLASYAWSWIRAFQLKFVINDAHLVKIGTTDAQRKLFFGMDKYKKELEKVGLEVTSEDIAQHLDVKPKEVVEMQQRMFPTFSLSTPICGHGHNNDFYKPVEENSIAKMIADENAPEPAELLEESDRDRKLRTIMRQFKTSLPYRDRIIFERRFVKSTPDTFAKIGKDLFMTRQRVQQLEAVIKENLKKKLVANEIAI